MTGPAARQKRWRQRQRDGQVVAPVPVSPAVIETLIDLGWLSLDRSEDRADIGQAIAGILEDVANHAKKP